MYFNKESHEYIANKYHETSIPFDHFQRFTRNDSIFHPDTGMRPEDVISGIWENDEQYRLYPHSIRKARAIEYVLENTRISCDSRDLFPAINCIDRPIQKTLENAWNKEAFCELIPEASTERELFNTRGIARLGPDYSHCLPIWDRFLALGYSGIIKEAEEAKLRLAHKKKLNSKEEAFYDSIEITYLAIIRFVRRLARLANNTPGSEHMAKALANIQEGTPKTFYEALLFNYIYFMISEHIDSLQVRSSGHFDRLYYPYYQSDLQNGIREEELKGQLAYFLMQFSAIGNYWGQPIYIGGTDECGKTEVNHLSYVFLEVYDNMNLYNPKVQIKYSATTTPKDLILKVLDMVRRGKNSFVIVSEEHVRKSLRYNGISEEEIVHADIKGCYEFLVQGGADTEDMQLNLLKPLEFALHEGRDGRTGELIGIACSSDFTSYDDLFDEYKRQLAYVIDKSICIVNAFESYMAYINPASLTSATFPTSIESGKDANAGGGRTNNTYMCLGGIGSIADSLCALKKYVFDKKCVTLEEFIKAVDNNYESFDELRGIVWNDEDKYGNNLDLPDRIACDVVSFACDCIEKKPNSPERGGWWSCSTHIARGIYDFGKLSIASPDGRKAGDELSKNLSSTMGKNHRGITAAILTATKFDPMKIQLNPLVDASISPSAVKGNDGLEAMLGIMNTYFSLGGGCMQFNVVNVDDLRKAQQNPEQYKDLQIRVSGWSVLFNNISKKEQDGFILQAEMAHP